MKSLSVVSILALLIVQSVVCEENHDTLEESSGEYLDYAAAAHINPLSLEEFNRVSKLDGNSSGFSLHSKKLKDIEESSARVIADKIKCEPDQIIFTNSATMSNNIAILGVAKKNPGCHLITSEIEHKSVLNVFKYLESIGYKVSYIGVDRYGNLKLKQLKKSIQDDTRLVSIQSFNSEIGTQQNMKAIAEIVRSHKNIVFHSDISQAFGKYDVDISLLDMATFSGYKIGAPKGIAALYIKDRTRVAPILFGSGDDIFPGSKPTSLIAAFAKAVKEYKLNIDKIVKNFNILNENISKIDDVYINSEKPSHVFSVSIKGVLLRDLIENLEDFAFSSGCSCLGTEGESNVKQAIDPKGELPSTTLRISFSDKVSSDQLIRFAKKLKENVEQLREKKSVSDTCEKIKDQDELKKVLMSVK